MDHAIPSPGYLVAWRKRAASPSGDERRVWLYGVARRLLAEHHRTACARTDAERGIDGTAPAGSSTEDDVRDVVVRRALESLGDLDRELVTLTTWEGLSPAEAARVVGITPATARVRLHRARARLSRHPRLRALLDDAGPEASPTMVTSST